MTILLLRERAPDVCDPDFLALISHLAYAIKEQATFSLCPIKALGNSLKEMPLIVSCLSFLLILLSLEFSDFVSFYCSLLACTWRYTGIKICLLRMRPTDILLSLKGKSKTSLSN